MHNKSLDLPPLTRWRLRRWTAVLLILGLAAICRAQVTGLDGAVSIWLFEEGFGTSVATNEVDEAFNGVIVDHRSWIPGMYGEALVFDGDEDAVEVTSNPLIGAHELTVQAYINPHSIPDESSSKIINIALERETEGVDRFMVDILPSDDGSQWLLSHFMSIETIVSDPEEVLIETGTPHPFDRWYHVAMVFSSISPDSVVIRHYVDHVLEYETDYTVDTLTQGEVFIGERYAPKGIEQIRNYFDGAMDNLVLHDYALATEEFMPPPGTAAFDAEIRSGPVPLDVAFQNGSPNDVSSWNWDFGDGQTSTESEPIHSYTTAGLYTVILVGTGPAGPDTCMKPDFIEVTGSGVSIEGEGARTPQQFRLAQNYPNPFNLNTYIEYTLDEPQYIKLFIYGLDGTLIRILDTGYRSSGAHHCIWDGMDSQGNRLSSGIYLYRLESKFGNRQIRKMILMK